MRDPSFGVGPVLGVPLRVHVSWFVTVSLLTAVLATGSFPRHLPAAAPALHWVYGLVGALLLFASVLLHELSHALMARRRGLPVAGITLHGLGGVAEIEREPASPPDELWITIAGPMTSYALALAGGVALLVPGTPPGVTSVLGHFVVMNLTGGTFNLVPGFPLDGGRLLRAALWAWQGDHDRATRSASRVGAVVAMALVGLGILSAARTGAIAGLWLVAVGLYLRRAAGAAGLRLTVQRALESIPVRVAMTFESAAVTADTTVDDMVRDHFSPEGTGCAVLGAGGAVVGIVTYHEVGAVPEEERSTTTVSDVMVSLPGDLTTAPAASCWDAFCRLQRVAGGRLLVLEDGRLVGTLGLDDLAPLLAWSRRRP
jgi:Zn-dependent protease